MRSNGPPEDVVGEGLGPPTRRTAANQTVFFKCFFVSFHATFLIVLCSKLYIFFTFCFALVVSMQCLVTVMRCVIFYVMFCLSLVLLLISIICFNPRTFNP